MIKDKLDNAKTYYNISENLKKGFKWLKNTDLKTIKPDRYYIDGEKLFANVQEYATKADAKYEAHRKYIDIQYMIKGEELVGVTNKNNCKTCDEYNSETDLEFMNCSVKEEYLTLDEGTFMVFFPQDAHKPSINSGEQSTVKKVIVKVAID